MSGVFVGLRVRLAFVVARSAPVVPAWQVLRVLLPCRFGSEPCQAPRRLTEATI
jgi:hypothetical protein